MTQPKNGDTVKVHYTGKLEDGTVFDSSRERDQPLEFTLGQGMVIPGFEKAVAGMAVGDQKEVTLEVDEAYGPHNESLVVEVSKDNRPPDIQPELGAMLRVQTPDGQVLGVRIVEINDDSIKIDGNHALAGEKLIFELELVEIS